MTESSKRRPPSIEVMGSSPVLNICSHAGRVRQHSAESRGFSVNIDRVRIIGSLGSSYNRPLKSP